MSDPPWIAKDKLRNEQVAALREPLPRLSEMSDLVASDIAEHLRQSIIPPTVLCGGSRTPIIRGSHAICHVCEQKIPVVDRQIDDHFPPKGEHAMYAMFKDNVEHGFKTVTPPLVKAPWPSLTEDNDG